MKKSILIAVAVLLCACNKETETEKVQVSFGYEMFSGQSITKSASAIRTALESLNPEHIQVVANGEVSGESVLTTDVDADIYPDAYTFTADYIPPQRCVVYNGRLCSSNQPRISINDSFSVDKSQTNYTLEATYNCFAIVLNKDEVADICAYSSSDYITCLSFITNVGDYDIVFVETVLTDMRVELVPENEDDYNHAYYIVPENPNGKFFYGKCLLKSVYGNIAPDYQEWGEGEWNTYNPE